MQEEKQPSDIIDRVSCICDSLAKGQWEDMEDLFSLVADRSVPNDIRGLAETFANMAVQIEARQFLAGRLIDDLRETQRQLQTAKEWLRVENDDLRERLSQYDINYDETRAREEIRDVSETEYFRSLQQRARSMRTMFKAPRSE